VTQTSAVGTTTQTTTQTSDATAVNPGSELGKDDFLKLLVTQLQNQDPTNPTDSSTWMAQLAQYSSLEQETNVAESVGQLVTSSAQTQGVDLLGHQLTWTRADGSTGIGVADGMTIQDGSPVLDVNGEDVTLDEVTSVAPASTDVSSPQTSTTA
jgi:flagellar basal-body rod modification protein FlgD